MENTMHFILEGLHSFNPDIISSQSVQTPISIERITENSTFRSSIIYVGYQSEIQQQVSRMHKSILFLIEDTADFVLPLNQNNEIVLFPKDTDIYRLLEECRNLLRRRVLLDSKSRQLLECINQTNDIDEIISIIAEQLQNPVIVLDISYKVLGYSKNFEVEDYQWQQNISRGYCSFEYIGAFNRIEGVASSPDSNEPFIIECFTSHFRRYVSKLYLDKRQVGYLISIESVTPFSQIDPQLFKIISNSLARIIDTRNQLAQNVNNRMYDSVFIDCLEGNFKSRDAFMERIALTGIKMGSYYQLLAVDISSYNNFDPGHEYLRQLIHQLLPQSIMVCYNNNVVVLTEVPSEDSNTVKILKNNIKIFNQYKIRVGISDVFTDLFQITIQYQNAVSAMNLSQFITSETTFALYDDYKIYNFIYSSLNENNLENFIHSKVKRILDYDRVNNTEYFQTMHSYLKNARRLDDTASDLFIHKNTVSYRINKIREIFGIDFDDASMEFNLNFSCKIAAVLYQHILKPSE